MAETLDEALNELEQADDESAMFVIHNDLRTITGPTGFVLGVYHDKNVQKLPFRMPRYFNDIDLSKYAIAVNYRNANNEINPYFVPTKTVADDHINFDWIVDSPAFVKEGQVSFAVCLTYSNTDPIKLSNEFNTTVYTLTVLEGIEVQLTESDQDTVSAFQAYVEQKTEEVKKYASDANADLNSIKTIQSDIDSSKTHIDSIKENIDNSKTHIDDVKTDVDTSKEHVDEVEHNIVKISSDISNIQSDVNTSKEHIDTIKSDIDEIKTHIDDVKTDVDTSKEHVDEVKSNVDNSKEYVNSRKTEVSSIYDQINDIYTNAKKIVDGLTDISGGMSELELQISTDYQSRRTGEVFATKFYYHSTNTTSIGTKLHLVDGEFVEWDNPPVAKPSVGGNDKVAAVINQDDFLQYLPFQWAHCNYVRDDNGFARPTVLEGYPGYKTTGSVDVGMIAPTFFWGMQRNPGAGYYILMMSDSPHPELGLVPFIAAIIPGKGYMPYYILSAYPSVEAEDGLLRSQPGKYPAYNQSYNNMMTNYQKKGAGYWGGGAARQLHWIIFTMIKAANKSSQTYSQGCSSFSEQKHPALSESGVKRVLLTSTIIYEGACVSVSSTGLSSAPDRGTTQCNATANRVKVLSVEDVNIDGTAYKAINLDIADPIDVDATMYITTMPCFSGETDSIPGLYDGAYLSNTNGRHTLRIHGVEYSCGQAIILSDQMMKLNLTDDSWDVYTCIPGNPHKSSPDTYKLVGKNPRNNWDQYWIGDLDFDQETGGYFIKSIGSGSGTGIGDYVYQNKNETQDGSLREYYSTGTIWDGSSGGFGCVYCGVGLGYARWHYGSCD